jgi:hypothetical protein
VILPGRMLPESYKSVVTPCSRTMCRSADCLARKGALELQPERRVSFDDVTPNVAKDISSSAYDYAASRVEVTDNRAKGVACYDARYTMETAALSTLVDMRKAKPRFSSSCRNADETASSAPGMM